MTLDEMEAQAQRALDGMKVNTNVMAENQLRLIALVRNARDAAEKKPVGAERTTAGSFAQAMDEMSDIFGKVRGGQA